MLFNGMPMPTKTNRKKPKKLTFFVPLQDYREKKIDQ